MFSLPLDSHTMESYAEPETVDNFPGSFLQLSGAFYDLSL